MKSSEKVQLRQRRLIPRGDVCVSIYHSSGYVPDLPPELFLFLRLPDDLRCNLHDGLPLQKIMQPA